MTVPEQGRDQTDGKGRRTEHSHPNTAEGLRRKADRKQQPERQQIHQRRRAEDRAAAGFDPHALARLDRKRRAQEDGIDFSNGRVYGPHGGGLVAANDPTAYDKAVSARLTERAVHANLEVRALGFKPYLAPALSSAAVSILSLVRGQPYDAALPLGGVWLGAQRRMTPLGPLQRREPLHPALLARIEAARLELEAFCHDA